MGRNHTVRDLHRTLAVADIALRANPNDQRAMHMQIAARSILATMFHGHRAGQRAPRNRHPGPVRPPGAKLWRMAMTHKVGRL